MADIFISYTREDRARVEPLAKALEEKGWVVWWDARIRSGEPFDRIIEKALAEARSVVAVWSTNSVESDWVRVEAGDGFERGILISVAIERYLKPPLRFRNIHTDSLIDWDGKKPSETFEKIVSDLKTILSSTDPQDTSSVRQGKQPELDAMAEIPSGECVYQSEKGMIDNPYLIDIYPVTNQQYEKFINAGGYQKLQPWSKEGQIWLYDEKITKPKYWENANFNQPDQPVVGISYYEAEAFADSLGKRLPTEKEWERAARGVDGRKYPWGNEFDRKSCNILESGIGNTNPVTVYKQGISPAGCYDMIGNVWEWTSSLYANNEEYKVLRGGSWDAHLRNVQCTSRYRGYPDDTLINVGFRCVKDIINISLYELKDQ